MAHSEPGQLLHDYQGGDGDLIVLIGAHCPACGYEHSFRVNAEYWAREGKEVWEFNGDYDRPTFYPSMGVKTGLRPGEDGQGVYYCHSFLTDGQWHYLDDCKHDMAGQVVPMVPIKPPSEWGFRGRAAAP